MTKNSPDAAQPTKRPRSTSPTRTNMGANLAELRSQAGLRQPELAARTGIPSFRISRIENDHAELRAGELVKLAKALGVSLDRLILGRVPPCEKILTLWQGLTPQEQTVVERMLAGLLAQRGALPPGKSARRLP